LKGLGTIADVVIVRAGGVSPEPRVEKLAESLGQNGYHVNVLAWDREGIHPQRENRGCYSIRRLRIRAPEGSLLVAIPLMFWMVREFLYLLRSGCQVIHACGFDTMVPAALAKTITGKRIVYDIFDFYADILPRSVPKTLRNLVGAAERLFIRTADAVIIVDEARMGQIGRIRAPVEVIVNSPRDTRAADRPGISHDRFVLFYAAQLGENNARAIEFVARAIRTMNDVALVVAGWGPAKNRIVQLAKQQPNIRFAGRLSYTEVMEQTRQADALFAFYDPRTPIARLASPNKLFEAMAAAKPIIINSETAAAHVVSRLGCGLVVPFADIRSLKSAIQSLKDDRQLAARLGARGRNAFETQYSWQLMEKKLLKLYHEVAGSVRKPSSSS
jgi:glycosyltransferase involved in cell wall biosynthesis